jgi:hypothetical protein
VQTSLSLVQTYRPQLIPTEDDNNNWQPLPKLTPLPSFLSKWLITLIRNKRSTAENCFYLHTTSF